MRRFWQVAPEETVEDMEFLMSNRGACDFLVKADGKVRQFELTEMYVGNGDLTLPVVLMQFLTTVRGKLCWNIVYRDDILSEEEAKMYVECIQQVLGEIELE